MTVPVTPSRTLGDMVVERGAAARVLERHDDDGDAGGARPSLAVPAAVDEEVDR